METIKVGDLVIYTRENRVEWNGEYIRFTPREWQVLVSLGLCAGSMVTRAMLRAVVHRTKYYKPSLKSVDVLVCRVRYKLAAGGGRDLVVTVRGQGYMLRDLSANDNRRL